jgi:hypothetical protein
MSCRFIGRFVGVFKSRQRPLFVFFLFCFADTGPRVRPTQRSTQCRDNVVHGGTANFMACA